MDGGAGWASAAFHSCNSTRHRSGGKPQVLGKHKSAPDSGRSQKSKVSRTAESCEELPCPRAKFLPSFPRPLVELDDLHSDVLEDGSDCCSLFPSVDSDLVELYSIEVEEYDPEFLTGLDDLGTLQDNIDIG